MGCCGSCPNAALAVIQQPSSPVRWLTGLQICAKAAWQTVSAATTQTAMEDLVSRCDDLIAPLLCREGAAPLAARVWVERRTCFKKEPDNGECNGHSQNSECSHRFENIE